MNLEKFKKDGKFLMLALDHRGSFKKYVNPNPESATDEDVVATKRLIIESLEEQFSGVLIDPTWGLPAYQNPQKPYLLCLEKTGYTDKAGERVTELEYSAAELKKMGASGTKILLYFNPEAPTCAAQIETAKKVLADSHDNELPLFLEIVTYGNEELGRSRSEWVSRSLVQFIENGVVPDVWKLEYPGDLESCKKITELAGNTPWILLTRGESFEVFEKQLQTAIEAGAVGFLAGRALWQEIGDFDSESVKKEFLKNIVSKRFEKIAEISKK